MPSKLIYDKNGWLFQEPQKNLIHDISLEDIKQLILYADQDEAWAEVIKNEVVERDKALREGRNEKRVDWVLEEFQITQTSGTIIHMPYGLRIITFPCKMHLFRGEVQNYHRSIPSLNRIIKEDMDEKEKELLRVISYLRKWQFGSLIWKINVVPYWEAKLSDVNLDALAQHYGFATHLLDLTNDFRVALFFATCKYVPEIDSFRPLTKEDIGKSEDTEYGYIFHAPDWIIDYMNGWGFLNWSSKHLHDSNQMEMINRNKRYYLQSGDMDGVALQIGYQPLQRCDHQSAYIYPMRNEQPLQENWHFEKMRFKHSIELSQQVYDMMDGGKKVFPNEGISELHDYIQYIQHNVVFSEEELQIVYECDGIDRNIFPTIDDLKSTLVGFSTSDGVITIKDKPIAYEIPQKLLEQVNSRYDGKDLMTIIGGMIHQKEPDRLYREQRCIEIYGKLI